MRNEKREAQSRNYRLFSIENTLATPSCATVIPPHCDVRAFVETGGGTCCMEGMDRSRKRPAGVQSFEELRAVGCRYVDKTDFVCKLATEGKQYFLSGLSRFFGIILRSRRVVLYVLFVVFVVSALAFLFAP